MMQSIFINLLFAACVLVGCGVPTNQREQLAASQEPSIVADKSSNDPCDFSSFAPVRIKQFDRKAITKRVQPEYPLEAAQGGVEGRVVVKALVNEKGIVERACAVEGEEVLRKAAEKAALQWKLKPRYGLAFVRPKSEKNPKNFAEVYIVFEFKLDKTGSKGTTIARP
jgi:outer membrane biosynthesis protein TonB